MNRKTLRIQGMQTAGSGLLTFVLALLLTLSSPPLQAFHYPWDQGHDTTDWNDPPPPGPCPGGNCDPCKNATGPPVYLLTGHYITTEVDIRLPGRPLLGLQRSNRLSRSPSLCPGRGPIREAGASGGMGSQAGAWEPGGRENVGRPPGVTITVPRSYFHLTFRSSCLRLTSVRRR